MTTLTPMKKTIFNTLKITICCMLITLINYAYALSSDEVVVATTQEVLNRLEIDRERLKNEPDYIKEIVQELIVPHMDFYTMAGLVLGKDWSVLSDVKKDCFSNGFRNLLVERYSHILLSYRDQDVSYQPATPIGLQGYVSVVQTLTRDDRKPLTIGYPMRPDGDSWSVVDLVVDHVSLVRSYRLMFEKEIKEKGLADFIHSFRECNP